MENSLEQSVAGVGFSVSVFIRNQRVRCLRVEYRERESSRKTHFRVQQSLSLNFFPFSFVLIHFRASRGDCVRVRVYVCIGSEFD